jgi:hypothetical protein
MMVVVTVVMKVDQLAVATAATKDELKVAMKVA